jgi:hypothetical protein
MCGSQLTYIVHLSYVLLSGDTTTYHTPHTRYESMEDGVGMLLIDQAVSVRYHAETPN